MYIKSLKTHGEYLHKNIKLHHTISVRSVGVKLIIKDRFL